MRDNKLSGVGNISQLNLIIPFNNAIIKPYWLVLGSPSGTIKLNENIDSDRHSVVTSNNILSSNTWDMFIRLLREKLRDPYA